MLSDGLTSIEGPLRSILVGSMLGDGRLDRLAHSTRYMENHGAEQRDYIAWKVEIWGPWVKSGLKPVTWRRAGREYPGWRFETSAHPALNEWHELFYDSTGPKRLDQRIVEKVDGLALAVWYLDDGSTGWWPRITFGQPPASRGVALSILERHGLRPRWEPHRRDTGDLIFEGESEAEKFIALIGGYVPDCMVHKLRFGFQGPHYQLRQTLDEGLLRRLTDAGMPIKRMARELGQSATTISRYLKRLGIEHPRRVGRPLP